MEKKALFMAFNVKTGVINAAASDDYSVIEGLKFNTPLTIQLPEKESKRFASENPLVFIDGYSKDLRNLGGKNPEILFTDLKFIKSVNGIYTYSAVSWEWVE